MTLSTGIPNDVIVVIGAELYGISCLDEAYAATSAYPEDALVTTSQRIPTTGTAPTPTTITSRLTSKDGSIHVANGCVSMLCFPRLI